MTGSLSTPEGRRAAEAELLSKPAAEQVDANKIKRGEFVRGLFHGAIKWGGYAAAAVALTGTGVVMMGGISAVVAAVGLSWLTGITLTQVALAGAGVVAAGALVGGITGAGQALAESDEKIQAEIDRIARAQDRVRFRQFEREQTELTAAQQQLEFQKQTLAMRGQIAPGQLASPQLPPGNTPPQPQGSGRFNGPMA